MRRAVFYLFFDPQGRVDDCVLHTLAHLRRHAELVFVVSNSTLEDSQRARLQTVADQVWERENVGLDVWAYKEAMHVAGQERLAELDEIVMMNYTFFGPVGSFDDLFTRMDARDDLDFWGITEHGDHEHHPYDASSPLEAHLQSHWIAVRRRMYTSQAWSDYWHDMPMIMGYEDSILRHESTFTKHFGSEGFIHAATFPAAGYDSMHPIMDNAAQLLRDGCPIVKRRLFFHDPLYNESHATDGRQVARLMEERGYPVELMYANLARSSKPRSMVTNLGLLEVLPEVDLGYDPESRLRVVAVAHIFYPEMTDEIVDRLDLLPGTYDLVVTTSDQDKKTEIDEVLRRRGRSGEVRVVGSNRGRDVSAFFVDCADVIDSDRYDIVVKLHSKKTPQDGANIGEQFKLHLFDNLLASAGYAANVLRLFQQHPSLGMVFPPVYHLAYPTLGHAWFGNKDAALEEAKRLGVTVPFDDNTPLAAYGSMFVARTQALRALTSAGYRHLDFPDESGYADGALTHVLERLVSYIVLSSGWHVREVMNAQSAATNYSYLEYRTITLSAMLPAYPRDQVRRLARLKYHWKVNHKAARAESRKSRAGGAETALGTGTAEPTPFRRRRAPAGRGRPAGTGGTTWRRSR